MNATEQRDALVEDINANAAVFISLRNKISSPLSVEHREAFAAFGETLVRWTDRLAAIPMPTWQSIETAPHIPDKWITWKGGSNPVPGQQVMYRIRSGETSWDFCVSDDLRWEWTKKELEKLSGVSYDNGVAADIVAYKVKSQ